MQSQWHEIPAWPRETGSRASRRLRREGRVPAGLYGHGEAPLALAVSARDLEQVLASGHRQVMLRLENGQTERAVVRDVQPDRLRGGFLSVDFQRVSEHEVVRAEIPVEVRGESELDRRGLALVHHLSEVTVEGPSDALPDAVTVDVSRLTAGQQRLVRDLVLPEGVRCLTEPDEVVVSVVAAQAAEGSA